MFQRTQSFKVYFTIRFLLIFTLLVTLASVFSIHSLKQYTLQQVHDKLLNQLHLIHPVFESHMDELGQESLHQLARRLSEKGPLRITVIQPDGKVVAESERSFEDFKKLDNHLHRPEVQEALTHGDGESVRFSKTMSKDMLYMAKTLQDNQKQILGVLRTAIPYAPLREYLGKLKEKIIQCAVILVLVVSGLILTAAHFLDVKMQQLQKNIQDAIHEDYPRKIKPTDSGVLQDLEYQLNRLAKVFRKQLRLAKKTKTESSAILRHMSEGVIAIDEQQIVTAANPKATEILGLKDDIVIGRSLIEVVRNQSVYDLINEAIKKKTALSKEVELLHPKRRILKVHAIGFSEQEIGLRGIMVFYDITTMKHLENVRKEFVANASHELKTPLTSIKGFIETLEGGAIKDAKQASHFIGLMKADADRLQRLIDDLLELSKIESKQMPLKKQKVDLQQEVKSVLTSFQVQLTEKRIQVENQIHHPESRYVHADPDQLKQVFINLIDNAIKYNQTEGKIFIRSRLINSGEVEVSVADTGIGVPQDAVDRIFERFYTVDTARSRELGGTGLGLSIVKHIIESHQGRVSCQTALGKGTTISFTLPVSTA